MSGELKERARQVIECLAKLDQSKRPGGGVHGQVIGMEPYVIRTTGDGLQCLYEAQSLLDELLDPFDRRPAQGALTDALPGWYNVDNIAGLSQAELNAAMRQYAQQCIEARNQQGALTDAQIAAGAAILCDHGTPIGRNAAISVYDAMTKGTV